MRYNKNKVIFHINVRIVINILIVVNSVIMLMYKNKQKGNRIINSSVFSLYRYVYEKDT